MDFVVKTLYQLPRIAYTAEYCIILVVCVYYVCLCSFLQLLEAMGGQPNVVECAFVESDVTEAAYFATPLTLGKNGVEKNNGMGTLSEFEKEKLREVRWSCFLSV